MNLYDLHENPEQLYGFDIVPYKNPELAYNWLMDHTGTSRKIANKLEFAIMKTPKYAYYYAVKNYRRWPEAEPYIMKDPQYAYYYASDVLHGPWFAAEPYIKKDPKWWDSYSKEFKNFIY